MKTLKPDFTGRDYSVVPLGYENIPREFQALLDSLGRQVLELFPGISLHMIEAIRDRVKKENRKRNLTQPRTL